MNVTPAGGPELLSMVASLMVVVGAVVVVGWLASRSKLIGAGNSDAISIVASRALGAKERLLLVEIAGKQLLVAMAPGQVRTLHVFDEPVVSRKADAIANPAGFAGRLKSALQDIRR